MELHSHIWTSIRITFLQPVIRLLHLEQHFSKYFSLTPGPDLQPFSLWFTRYNQQGAMDWDVQVHRRILWKAGAVDTSVQLLSVNSNSNSFIFKMWCKCIRWVVCTEYFKYYSSFRKLKGLWKPVHESVCSFTHIITSYFASKEPDFIVFLFKFWSWATVLQDFFTFNFSLAVYRRHFSCLCEVT